MRVFQLLACLAGLFAMVFAAPAPEVTPFTTAPTDAAATALPMPVKAYLCNERGGKGGCVHVIATWGCAQLPVPFIFEIKSIAQDPYTFCFYTKDKDCKNTAFVAVSYYNYQVTDISSEWAGSIAGVQCVSMKQDLINTELITSPDVSGSEISARSDEAASSAPGPPLLLRAFEAPAHPLTLRDNTHHLLPSGKALLCSAESPTAHCVTALTDGQCTDLTSTVDRNVHTVFQNRGLLCEYFTSSSCHARLGSSDSTNGDLKVAVPPEIVGRIVSARCTVTTTAWGEDTMTAFVVDEGVSGE